MFIGHCALRLIAVLFSRLFCDDENIPYLQAKGRSLEQILPSQPSEGTHPVGILILDLKVGDYKFLWFKPLSLWYITKYHVSPRKLIQTSVIFPLTSHGLHKPYLQGD